MALRAYNGLLGSGKTYSMVRDATVEMRKKGVQVYTNMAGLRCPEAIYFADLSDIMEARTGVVLFDEANSVLGSRFWQELPRDILTRFNQLRKHGLDLWFTCQAHDAVDKSLRDITNEIVSCTNVGGKAVLQRMERVGQGRRESRPLRALVPFCEEVYSVYDTMEVISTQGGSAGRATHREELSLVARRRLAVEDDQRRFAAEKKRFELWQTDGLRGAYTLEAHKARLWLEARALLRPNQPIAVQVRRELDRRRWLAIWGLTERDVPDTCRRDQPWLDGYDPAQVTERAQAREALELEAAALALERRRAGKTPPRSRSLAG